MPAAGHCSDVQSPNPVLRYLALTKAASDFGLDHREIQAVAGRPDQASARCGHLAQALADLILARTRLP